jgi:hypothetical protein
MIKKIHSISVLLFAFTLLVGCSDDDDRDTTTSSTVLKQALALPESYGYIGGNFELYYYVENVIEGQNVVATSNEDNWLHINSVTDGKVQFSVDLNQTMQSREGIITVKYADAEPLDVKVVQRGMVSFTVNISAITRTSAHYEIVASDAETPYFVSYLKKSTIESSLVDEVGKTAFLQDYTRLLKEQAELTGVALKDLLQTGNKVGDYTTLEEGTDYVIFMFGMTEDGIVTTPLMTTEFKTDVFRVIDDCTFTFEISNMQTSAYGINFDVKINPSNRTTRWYANILPTAYLSTGTKEEWADAFIEMESEYDDIDWTVVGKGLHVGTTILNTYVDMFADALPETEYVVLAFGIDKEGVRTTEVSVSDPVMTPSITADALSIKLSKRTLHKVWTVKLN